MPIHSWQAIFRKHPLPKPTLSAYHGACNVYAALQSKPMGHDEFLQTVSARLDKCLESVLDGSSLFFLKIFLRLLFWWVRCRARWSELSLRLFSWVKIWWSCRPWHVIYIIFILSKAFHVDGGTSFPEEYEDRNVKIKGIRWSEELCDLSFITHVYFVKPFYPITQQCHLAFTLPKLPFF